MSEHEKRDTLELIKRLPPEKQAYVAGIATGLAMSEELRAGAKQEEAAENDRAAVE